MPIRRSKPKPNYPYALGAYSTSPQIRKVADGVYSADGSVQAWRGSTEDLCRVTDDAVAALAERAAGEPSITATISLWLGQSRTFATLAEFRAAAAELDDDQISAIRIDVAEGPLSGTLVARRRMPGVLVSAQGPDRIEVDGLARLMFAQAMQGYVDRYGGVWRPFAAIAVTLVPVALALRIGTSLAEEWPAWATALFAAAALAVCFVVMVNSWQWTLVRTPLDLIPNDAPERRDIRARVGAFLGHPRVARVLALAGVIVIGIVTNKISDVIHWP